MTAQLTTEQVWQAKRGNQFSQAIDEQGASDAVKHIDKSAAYVYGGHKHEVHNQQEKRYTKYRAQHETIDVIRDCATDLLFMLHDSLGQNMRVTKTAVSNMDIGVFTGPFFDGVSPFADFIQYRFIEALFCVVVTFEQFQRKPVLVGQVRFIAHQWQ